jgi:hypothetical protein
MNTEIRKRKMRQNSTNDQRGRTAMVINLRQEKYVRTLVLYISLISGLITSLLVARIGIMLIALTPGTFMGSGVIYVTNLLLLPFASMTETISGPYAALLELSSLTAVIVYLFIAWCIIRSLRTLYPQYVTKRPH